jgi:D-alanyl-D-alanine dipeptidase
MWKIVSNPEYVANPAKGSVHNREEAVDITLVDDARERVKHGNFFRFWNRSESTIPMYLWKKEFLSEHL